MSRFIKCPSGLVLQRDNIVALEPRPPATSPPGRPYQVYISGIFATGEHTGHMPVSLSIAESDADFIREYL